METRVYVICEKSFKNQQIAKNPKNSPTIFGTIMKIHNPLPMLGCIVSLSKPFFNYYSDRLLDEIVAELVEGNRLEFRDFGVFETKIRAARDARNPRTLEQVHIPAKRAVKFKMGRIMKQTIGNNQE